MNRGYAVLEGAGMVVTALAAQAAIRAWFNRNADPFWGLVDWAPRDLSGRLTLLGFVALAGLGVAGWARIRQRAAAGIRDRATN